MANSQSVEIGKISYSSKLKKLSYTNFKKFWKGEAERTGLSAEDAAVKFGIKAPTKKPKEE